MTVTSRGFNHDLGGAKRATVKGPVFITDRGRPSHVLLSIEDYQRLNGSKPSIAELLSSPETADFDFESFLPPRVADADRSIEWD